jgi:dihydroflavonol-4-reductase
MKKDAAILITGANGLLGAYLVKTLLHQGFENIHVLLRKNSDKALIVSVLDKIKILEGDVLYIDTLEDAFQGIEYVFHCAAIVSYDSRDRKKLMQTNVEGTANVVNFCLEKEVKKLIHVSSIAAIGRDKHQPTVTEKNKWVTDKDVSQYARSKYLAEQEVWRGAAEGLCMAIVNPPIILGSGDWRKTSTALFKQVWDGLRFYPTGTTGFVDVRDVARFMVMLAESEVESERFIVSGGNLSFRDFFTAVAKNLGKKPPSIKVNAFLSGVAWRLEWLRSRLTGKRALITQETAASSAATYYFDATKTTNFFSFQYTPLATTISETCQQFLEAAEKDFEPRMLRL